MKNKITVNNVSISKKLRGLIDDDVMLFAQNEFYKAMFDYIPFDTGTLSENVDITKDGVHFRSYYASYVYWGSYMDFKKDKHPLATYKWDKVAMISKKDKLAKSIENYIRLMKKND